MVLAGLSLASFSGVIVLIAFMLFILPGLVLLVAPNILLYGGVLRLSVWTWRTRRAPLLALLVLSVTALAALGAPWWVNQRLDAEARALTAGDFDHIPPGAPRPRTVQLVPAPWRADCTLVCLELLSRGLAQRVVLKNGPDTAVYGWSDASACRAVERYTQTSRACLRKAVGSAPPIDVLLSVKSPYGRRRTWSTAMRLDPLSLGPQTAAVLEVLPCAGCAPLARRTYLKQAYLVAPLYLYVDGEKDTRFSRAWARKRQGGDADPVAFLAQKWPIRP